MPNLCSVLFYDIIYSVAEMLLAIVLQGGWPLFLHRMEVMLMKNNFDFKDLMSFGMFIIALLTFIYLICH